MKKRVNQVLVKPAELIGKIISPETILALQLWLVIGEKKPISKWIIPFLILYGVSIFVPRFSIHYLATHGHIRDTTFVNRRERTNPLLFIAVIISIVCPFILAKFLNLPEVVYSYYITMFMIIVVFYCLTFLLKVSGHTAAITATATIALIFNSKLEWLLFLSIPFVCAARIITRDHTLIEVIIGSLIGFIIPIVIFRLL